jgi:hypothetical protein
MVMRVELKDAGASFEFWALEVDPQFDAAMAALAWQRSGQAGCAGVSFGSTGTSPVSTSRRWSNSDASLIFLGPCRMPVWPAVVAY